MPKIVERITLEQVRAAKPKTIFYGANTCWWTHDSAHLAKTPSARGMPDLPCDPRGGMLFETDDIEGFFKAAEENVGHYGRHGLRAFIAAHHLNCQREDGQPWCFETWDEYNDLIDA